MTPTIHHEAPIHHLSGPGYTQWGMNAAGYGLSALLRGGTGRCSIAGYGVRAVPGPGGDTGTSGNR
jgi:hypothetical protein